MKNNKDLDDLIAKLNHIDIVVNATHLNYINSNSLFYTIDAAKSGGTSWIIPYKKPQLLYHDKPHVTAGLRLLNRSNFSESTKSKIKACLYRKGKKYGIAPQEDELMETPDLITYRLSDEFTDEEIKQIADFFIENPRADEPTIEDTEQINLIIDESITKGFEEIKLKDKDEIISFYDKILSGYKDVKTELNNLKTEIITITDNEKILNDKIFEQNTILISKEDEIKKLLKDNAQLTVNYKKIIIDSILDFKKYTGTKDEEYNKYDSRKIDSLMDTLTDFKIDSEMNFPRVKDETLKDSKESIINNSDKPITETIHKNRIDRFFKQPILTEE